MSIIIYQSCVVSAGVLVTNITLTLQISTLQIYYRNKKNNEILIIRCHEVADIQRSFKKVPSPIALINDKN